MRLRPLRVRRHPGGCAVAAIVSSLLTLVTACSTAPESSTSSDSSDAVTGTVTVFAAASLTDAFAALSAALEERHPDLEVRLNIAGSSTLREQLLEGAPADVFASASETIMDSVIEAGLVEGTATLFARNGLSIALPRGNPGGVTDLADFARDDLLIGLCARRVPCGELAHQALESAGVSVSLDTEEPDVRALLTKITADELDAGIVYSTDVRSAGDAIEAIAVTLEIAPGANYPIAVLAGSDHPANARAFVEFVTSAPGRSLLSDFGFEAP